MISCLLGMSISLKTLFGILKTNFQSKDNLKLIWYKFLLYISPLILICFLLAAFALNSISHLLFTIEPTPALAPNHFWYLLCFLSIIFVALGIKETSNALKFFKNILKDEPKRYELQDNIIKENLMTFCSNAKIKVHKFFIEPRKDISAETKYFKKQNIIILSDKCLSLSGHLLLPLIGHELIHIQKNDHRYSKNFFLWFGPTSFLVLSIEVILILNIGLVFLFPPNIRDFICSCLLALPIFIWLVLLAFDVPQRYLNQIQELRADRKACRLSGVSEEGIFLAP
jgi:Zn-dependent protease with chaperone function